MFPRLFFFAIASLALSVAPLFSQTRVDILVIYTPAVESFFNGPDGVEAQILATFAQSNQALEDSESDVAYNLVHFTKLPYVEAASLSTDLDRLEDPDDGFLDEAHALRDDYGADLVALMRRDGAGGLAGLANVLVSQNGNPQQAFSIFADEAGATNLTFAHEIGHNLGLRHALGEDEIGDGRTDFTEFGKGYVFTGNDGVTYRTIMSVTFDINGTRVPPAPLYSNPNITFEGVPAGDPNIANAALALELGAEVVAEFRATVPAFPTFFLQPRDQTVAAGEATSLPTIVRGVPPFNLQWYQGESGDRSNPVSSADNAVLELDTFQAGGQYWLEASNDNGTASSRSARIFALPQAPEPFEVLLETPNPTTGLSTSIPLFQLLSFPGAYVDRLEIEVFRNNDNVAGDTILTFSRITEDEELLPITEVRIDGSLITGVLIPTDIEVPLDRFLEAGTYRIDLTDPPGEPAPANRMFWGGTEEPGGPPSSISLDPIQNRPNWQFTVRLIGSEAQAFTLWQSEEGIADDSNNAPDDPSPLGIPIGAAYAYGLSLSEEPLGALPSAELSGEGQSIVFRFQVRANAADIEAVPQGANTLGQFLDFPEAQVTQIADNDPEVDVFEVTVPFSALNDQAPLQFFRLAVDFLGL